MPVYSEKGFSLTRELINECYVDLTGRKVSSVSDLAEIAQVLRHPGYEKLHYVYVKDGKDGSNARPSKGHCGNR